MNIDVLEQFQTATPQKVVEFKLSPAVADFVQFTSSARPVTEAKTRLLVSSIDGRDAEGFENSDLPGSLWSHLATPADMQLEPQQRHAWTYQPGMFGVCLCVVRSKP